MHRSAHFLLYHPGPAPPAAGGLGGSDEMHLTLRAGWGREQIGAPHLTWGEAINCYKFPYIGLHAIDA